MYSDFPETRDIVQATSRGMEYITIVCDDHLRESCSICCMEFTDINQINREEAEMKSLTLCDNMNAGDGKGCTSKGKFTWYANVY